MRVWRSAGFALTCLWLPATACQTPAPALEEPVESFADVVSVSVQGDPGAYDFAVEVKSPDTGCERYANWWEVIDVDGRLIYRRVLAHSHVDEQPFTRSGGPVPIELDSEVWVRAHMHFAGYGGRAFKGSVQGGFRAADLPGSFASGLAKEPPGPPDCRW